MILIEHLIPLFWFSLFFVCLYFGFLMATGAHPVRQMIGTIHLEWVSTRAYLGYIARFAASVVSAAVVFAGAAFVSSRIDGMTVETSNWILAGALVLTITVLYTLITLWAQALAATLKYVPQFKTTPVNQFQSFLHDKDSEMAAKCWLAFDDTSKPALTHTERTQLIECLLIEGETNAAETLAKTPPVVVRYFSRHTHQSNQK